MIRSAGNHELISRMKTAGAAKVLAALLIVAAGSAPLVASWHEAVVQHVRCSEHGELTHVNAPHVHRASPAGAKASIQSEENADLSDSHQHCDVAFVVQGSAQAPAVRTAVRFAPPRVAPPPVGVLVPRPGRTGVLASAPKTSPPLA